MIENTVENRINKYYGLLISAKTDKARRRYLNKMQWWISKRSPERIRTMELNLVKQGNGTK